MKHYGDITKLNGAELPAVDVITGGSPCQDLSVVGKCAGLAGECSGLFMEQIRVIKEMRQHDRDCGRTGVHVRPRYMVWENVPGAFSSNSGEDFRAVLEETAHIADKNAVVPQPPNGKWTTSGAIMGDGWSVAWRVLDAQFWGVPQRRRRIALVADFGGQSAPEILFERNGLCWDSAEGGETGKGTAGDAERGVAYAIRMREGCAGGGKGPLIQTEKSGTLWTSNDQTICYGICSYASNSMKSNNPHSGIYEADTSRTLDLNGGNPACNQGGIMVYDARGNGDGATATVTYCCEDIPHMNPSIELSPCLSARGYKSQHYVNDIAAVDCRNSRETGETFGTLQAKENGGQSLNYMGAVRTGRSVRRLTPLECERLQGYPDGWTDRKTYSAQIYGLGERPRSVQ